MQVSESIIIVFNKHARWSVSAFPLLRRICGNWPSEELWQWTGHPFLKSTSVLLGQHWCHIIPSLGNYSRSYRERNWSSQLQKRISRRTSIVFNSRKMLPPLCGSRFRASDPIFVRLKLPVLLLSPLERRRSTLFSPLLRQSWPYNRKLIGWHKNTRATGRNCLSE